MTNQDQIDHFITSLDAQTGCGSLPTDRWLKAFALLDKQIDDSKKTVVLLDEVSWMGQDDATFPGVLRTAWETYWHRHERLIVVICGSSSTWIKKNILGDTGFTGRFSRDYEIPELTLRECAEFWGAAIDRIAPREIIDVLSITGGVPRYLEEMDVGLSADENIRRMCFSKGGELFKDFDALFDPLLGADMSLKRSILEALVEGPKTGAELSAAIESAYNGRFNDVIRDLVGGGFVSDDQGKNPETGEEARISKYRLKDNYTRFYLKYVLPHRGEIERGAFAYSSIEQLPEWNAVRGLQFENLIVNNFQEVIPFLGLGATIVESAAPYRNARKCGQKRGLQIDLLVQTACTAYVVEVKRKRKIETDVEREVAEKVKRLPLRKGMSVRPALVYCGEIDPQVEARGFFDALIPVEKLLV